MTTIIQFYLFRDSLTHTTEVCSVKVPKKQCRNKKLGKISTPPQWYLEKKKFFNVPFISLHFIKCHFKKYSCFLIIFPLQMTFPVVSDSHWSWFLNTCRVAKTLVIFIGAANNTIIYDNTLFIYLFSFSRATPAAYGGSQARG